MTNRNYFQFKKITLILFVLFGYSQAFSFQTENLDRYKSRRAIHIENIKDRRSEFWVGTVISWVGAKIAVAGTAVAGAGGAVGTTIATAALEVGAIVAGPVVAGIIVVDTIIGIH